jgi:hypothetical protein
MGEMIIVFFLAISWYLFSVVINFLAHLTPKDHMSFCHHMWSDIITVLAHLPMCEILSSLGVHKLLHFYLLLWNHLVKFIKVGKNVHCMILKKSFVFFSLKKLVLFPQCRISSAFRFSEFDMYSNVKNPSVIT